VLTHGKFLSKRVQGRQNQTPHVLRDSLNLTRQNLPDYTPLFETTALVCNVLAQAQEFQRAHLLLHVALQKRTVLSVSHLFYSVGNTAQTVWKQKCQLILASANRTHVLKSGCENIYKISRSTLTGSFWE